MPLDFESWLKPTATNSSPILPPPPQDLHAAIRDLGAGQIMPRPAGALAVHEEHVGPTIDAHRIEWARNPHVLPHPSVFNRASYPANAEAVYLQMVKNHAPGADRIGAGLDDLHNNFSQFLQGQDYLDTLGREHPLHSSNDLNLR